MDVMNLHLSTRFMRKIVGKLIARFVYKKFGCKINIQLNDLDVRVIDGETKISTSLELKLDSNEFTKLMSSINLDD